MSDISDHLPVLRQHASGASFIVELGTRGGASTDALTTGARVKGALVLSVDIDDCSRVGDYDRWSFVRADDVAFSKEFPNWCRDHAVVPSIDLLFIDTSHYYQHTVEEISCWFPYLATHAVVIFHDTNMRRIYRFKQGALAIGWNNRRGVIQAIEEFLGVKLDERRDFVKTLKNWHITHYSHCNGLTILRRT